MTAEEIRNCQADNWYWIAKEATAQLAELNATLNRKVDQEVAVAIAEARTVARVYVGLQIVSRVPARLVEICTMTEIVTIDRAGMAHDLRAMAKRAEDQYNYARLHSFNRVRKLDWWEHWGDCESLATELEQREREI